MITYVGMDNLGYGASSGLSKLPPGFFTKALIVNDDFPKCWICCIHAGNIDGHRQVCQELCDTYCARVRDAIVFQRLAIRQTKISFAFVKDHILIRLLVSYTNTYKPISPLVEADSWCSRFIKKHYQVFGGHIPGQYISQLPVRHIPVGCSLVSCSWAVEEHGSLIWAERLLLYRNNLLVLDRLN